MPPPPTPTSGSPPGSPPLPPNGSVLMVRWNQALNTSWAREDLHLLLDGQSGTIFLYDKLVENGEVLPMESSEDVLPGEEKTDLKMLLHPQISEGFGFKEFVTDSDLKEISTSIVKLQINLGRHLRQNSEIMKVQLKKRAVFSRIKHAIRCKYQQRNKGSSQSRDSSDSSSSRQTLRTGSSDSVAIWANDRERVGTQALVELGVTTGLGLLFALLKQTWITAAQNSSGGVVLCNEVLRTALNVLISLPPLSLSNGTKIPEVGLKTLKQVMDFLVQSSSENFTSDEEGSQLCRELLLCLAIQQGRLAYLLMWIGSSFTVLKNSKQGTEKISASVFNLALDHIHCITGMLRHKMKDEDQLIVTPSGDCDLYSAAVLMLKRLVCQTESYTSSCTGPSSALYRRGSGRGDDTDDYNLTLQGSKSDAYLWGSNSSHQLAEGTQEKILAPKLTSAFQDVQKMEAGQYCTFVLHNDGRVSGCGKGSYGRLGLGDSTNQLCPKSLPISTPVKSLTSSRGSDGHTLALTEDGHVFSWGDGDYGKLGHGNTVTQKVPKQVLGPLAGKNVIYISAGYRHSAAVTDDGSLFTWGEGDFGRLGHGDSQSRFLPTRVKDLGCVGQVSCGAAHTLALSMDGRTCWSFGAGDHGKLGHGDTSRIYRPKVIEALQGMILQKVQAGSQVSLALTTCGQVWAWGTGPCLGMGNADAASMLPKQIADLAALDIVDISVGDSHCLALAQDCSVFSWGMNTMGQCGLGHAHSPIVTPQRITLLDGVPIHQISAGTSHSMAWTTLPSDRRTSVWHKPFCVDLSQETFGNIAKMLNSFAFDADQSESKETFRSKDDQETFLLSVISLLSCHFSMAEANSHFRPTSSSGGTGTGSVPIPIDVKLNLETTLYKFLDYDKCSKPVLQAIHGCLRKGMSVLLPPLADRVKKACELLSRAQQSSEQQQLSTSEQTKLQLILQSLDDPNVIGSLLVQAVVNSETETTLVEVVSSVMQLLKILLQRAGNYVSKSFTTEESDVETNDSLRQDEMALLFTLHTHFALCNLDTEEKDGSDIHFEDLGVEYMKLIFSLGQDLFDQFCCALKTSSVGAGKKQINVLEEFRHDNVSSTLLQVLHITLIALHDAPPQFVRQCLPHLSEFQKTLMSFNQRIVSFSDIFKDTDWNIFDLASLATILIAQTLGEVVRTGSDDMKSVEDVPRDERRFLQSFLFKNGLEETCLENGSLNTVAAAACQVMGLDQNSLSDKLSKINGLFRVSSGLSWDRQTFLSFELLEQVRTTLFNVEGLKVDENDSQLMLVLTVAWLAIAKHVGLSSEELFVFEELSLVMQYIGMAAESISSLEKEPQSSVNSIRVKALSRSLFLLFHVRKATETGPNQTAKTRLTFQADMVKEVYEFTMLTEDGKSCLKKFSSALRTIKGREKEILNSIPLVVHLLRDTRRCLNAENISEDHILESADDLYSQVILSVLGVSCDKTNEVLLPRCQLYPDLYTNLPLKNQMDLRQVLLQAMIQEQSDRNVFKRGIYDSSVSLIVGLGLELWHSGQIEDLIVTDSETSGGQNLWSILQDLLMSLPDNPNFRSAAKRLVMLATLIISSSTSESMIKSSESNLCMDKLASIYSSQLSGYVRSALPDATSFNVDIQLLSDFVTFIAILTSQLKKKSSFLSSMPDIISRWIWDLLEIERLQKLRSNLRLRLIAIRTAKNILISFDGTLDDRERETLLIGIMDRIEKSHWKELDAFSANTGFQTEESFSKIDVAFNTQKSSYCTLESPQTVVHGPGGKGYCLADKGFSTSCVQWKFTILKETRGNESTCLGISLGQVRDYSHRTTSDMWLYRAYSGNLYHNGEVQKLSSGMPEFSQSDTIVVQLDCENGTLSFGKNGGELKLAFVNLPSNVELFPVVVFYSLNPGEKVTIHDMKMCLKATSMSTSEPIFAPPNQTISQTWVDFLLALQANSAKWDKLIQEKVRKVLSDPSLEARLQRCVTHFKEAKDRQLEFGQSVDALVGQIWAPLSLLSGIDSGLRLGSRISVTNRCGYLLSSSSSNKTHTIKVAWEDDNSVTALPATSLSDKSTKHLYKLEKSLLQPKVVSLLYSLSNEMSLFINDLDWIKVYKSDQSKQSRESPENSESQHSSRDRRSSSLPTLRDDNSSKTSSRAAGVEKLTNNLVSSILDEVTGKSRKSSSPSPLLKSSLAASVQHQHGKASSDMNGLSHQTIVEGTLLKISALEVSSIRALFHLASSKEAEQFLHGVTDEDWNKETLEQLQLTIRKATEWSQEDIFKSIHLLRPRPLRRSELERALSVLHSSFVRRSVFGEKQIESEKQKGDRKFSVSGTGSSRQSASRYYLNERERERESRRTSNIRPTPTPRTSLHFPSRPTGLPGHTLTFRDEMSRASAAAFADIEGPRTTPIHGHLREMGFTDRHITQALRALSLNGDETNAPQINLCATWMIDHPLLARDDDSGASGNLSGLRSIADIRNYLISTANSRGQSLNRPPGGAALAPSPPPPSESPPPWENAFRNLLQSSTVDDSRTAFPNQLLYLGSQPHVTRVNRADSCGICFQPYPDQGLNAHMISQHPGCDAFYGDAICGRVKSDVYILCSQCLDCYADRYHSFPSPSTVERMAAAASFHSTNSPKNKLLVSVIQEEAIQRKYTSEIERCGALDLSEPLEKMLPYLGMSQDVRYRPALVFKEDDPLGTVVAQNQALDCDNQNLNESFNDEDEEQNEIDDLSMLLANNQTGEENLRSLQNLVRITRSELCKNFIVGLLKPPTDFQTILASCTKDSSFFDDDTILKSSSNSSLATSPQPPSSGTETATSVTSSTTPSPPTLPPASQVVSECETFSRFAPKDWSAFLITNGLSDLPFLYTLMLGFAENQLDSKLKVLTKPIHNLKATIGCLMKYDMACKNYVTSICTQNLMQCALGLDRVLTNSNIKERPLMFVTKELAELAVINGFKKMDSDNGNSADSENDFETSDSLNDVSLGRRMSDTLKEKSPCYDDRSSMSDDPLSHRDSLDRNKIDLKLLDSLSAVLLSANEHTCTPALKIWAAKLLAASLAHLSRQRVSIFASVNHADLTGQLSKMAIQEWRVLAPSRNSDDQAQVKVLSVEPCRCGSCQMMAVADSQGQILIIDHGIIQHKILLRPSWVQEEEMKLSQMCLWHPENEDGGDTKLLAVAIGSQLHIWHVAIGEDFEFQSHWRQLDNDVISCLSPENNSSSMLIGRQKGGFAIFNEKSANYQPLPHVSRHGASVIDAFWCESDTIFVVGFSDGVIYMANRETIIASFQRKLTTLRSLLLTTDKTFLVGLPVEGNEVGVWSVAPFDPTSVETDSFTLSHPTSVHSVDWSPVKSGVTFIQPVEPGLNIPKIDLRTLSTSACDGGVSRDVHQHLRLILHAHSCNANESQVAQTGKKCDVPHCDAMKTVLNHMTSCKLGRSCNNLHCFSSRQIINHWRQCNEIDCRLCKTMRQPPELKKEGDAVTKRGAMPLQNANFQPHLVIGDWKILAVGQGDGGIAVWNISPDSGVKPRHSQLLWGHPGQPVTHLAFHPGGDLLASASASASQVLLNIWSLATGSVVQTLTWPVSEVGGVKGLFWLNYRRLGVAFQLSQDLKILLLPTNKGNDWNLDNLKMASAFRASLLGKADDILSKTVCLRHFLQSFASILQTQYCHESNAVVNTETQLIYSQLLQTLVLIAYTFKIEKVVQVSSSLSMTNSGMKDLPTSSANWSWLVNAVNTLYATSALVNRTQKSAAQLDAIFNDRFEKSDKRFDARWNVKSDIELMQWATENPADWQLSGKCSAYLFGCSVHGELADSGYSADKLVQGKSFEIAQQVICGENCTFVIHSNGAVSACGEGSNGRLGLGNSDDYDTLTMLSALRGFAICQLSTSCGGGGHTLALATSGEVFSWGDGDHGKLGHGNSDRLRKPRLVTALRGLGHAAGAEASAATNVRPTEDTGCIFVSAGHRHSAAITADGRIATWGCGEGGRLGHGSLTATKKSPEIVTSLLGHKIGQVSCGFNHTLCVSEDGSTVWAFGDGQYGKLGLGHCSSKGVPQKIEALGGKMIRKALAGNNFSVFLTIRGSVLSCGHEKWTGLPEPVAKFYRPQQIPALENVHVVDVVVGSEHSLALSDDGKVWAWGNNSDGQLGISSKLVGIYIHQPTIVTELSPEKCIMQLSAGYQHSAAWTTPAQNASFHTNSSSYISSHELGLPTQIPEKFGRLQDFSVRQLRDRLRLLYRVSDLVKLSWRLLPWFPMEQLWPTKDLPALTAMRNESLRFMLTPQVYNLPLVQTLQKTMIQGRNYGPQVTVQRLHTAEQTGGEAAEERGRWTVVENRVDRQVVAGIEKNSIFSQIASQVADLNVADLRLPSRSWKVKLIGEGADDAGGVFDDVITEMCRELVSPNSDLNLLILTPNGQTDIGLNRDKYLLNSRLNLRSNSKDRQHLWFLGILLGIAIRTRKPIAINFAPMVWKLIANCSLSWKDLEEVDLHYARSLRSLHFAESNEIWNDVFLMPTETFEGISFSGRKMSLFPNSTSLPLTLANRKAYVSLAVKQRLREMWLSAQVVREGLAAMVPLPILELMPPSQLELLVCGLPTIPVHALKKVARYWDLDTTNVVVVWLWEILEDMAEEDKVLFMIFVSGRSRLPTNPLADLTQRFQILRVDRPVDGLPTAQTCFFQLRLPPYTSKDVMRERLLYAIRHCRTIDMDNYMLARNNTGPNAN